MASDTANPYPFELWAVIPAAGYGARVQSDIPKQYLFINGITIMETVISGLLKIPGLKGCMIACLLYTSPSPRDQRGSRMPSSA